MESDRIMQESVAHSEEGSVPEAKEDSSGQNNRHIDKMPEAEGYDKKLDGPDRPSI